MKNSTQKQFNCSDLYVVAFLKTNDVEPVSIDRTDRKRAVFIFNDFEGRESLLAAFWSKQASVEPRAFIAAIKDAKEQIYSQ